MSKRHADLLEKFLPPRRLDISFGDMSDIFFSGKPLIFDFFKGDILISLSVFIDQIDRVEILP